MKVDYINDWTLEDLLAKSERPLVVLFVTSGCKSRDLPTKEFAILASAYDEACFCIVDLLENPSLAERFHLSQSPTTLIFVDGAESTRHVGAWLERPIARILGPQPPLEDPEMEKGEFE